MKKILALVCLVMMMVTKNVYAMEKEEILQPIVVDVEDFDLNIKDSFQKFKNVFFDTVDSIDKTFPKVKETKEDIKEGYGEAKENFYEKNPDKKEQTEEIKETGSSLLGSIGDFFKSVGHFIFG